MVDIGIVEIIGFPHISIVFIIEWKKNFSDLYFMLIDELEKMNNTDQTSLLHLTETGIIAETKFNNTRQIELTSWLFATANSCQKIFCLIFCHRFTHTWMGINYFHNSLYN
jgi:hypothetical protein